MKVRVLIQKAGFDILLGMQEKEMVLEISLGQGRRLVLGLSRKMSE